jgi:hypothetical protein
VILKVSPIALHEIHHHSITEIMSSQINYKPQGHRECSKRHGEHPESPIKVREEPRMSGRAREASRMFENVLEG